MGRFRRVRSLVVAVLVTVVAVLALGSMTPVHAADPMIVDDPVASAQLLLLANRERSAAGLPLLEARADVAEVAVGHSRRMATAGDIFHNDDYFTPSMRQRLGARSLGENVAVNASADDAHRRLMLSSAHRANLMNPEFTVVGMAVVRAVDGTGFITQNFVEPVAATPRPGAAAGPAPQPEPAPAAPPAASDADASKPTDPTPVVGDDDGAGTTATSQAVAAQSVGPATSPATTTAAGGGPARPAATSGLSTAGAAVDGPPDADGAAMTTTALETVSVVTEPISSSAPPRQASPPSGTGTSPVVLILAAVAMLLLVTAAAARTATAARRTAGGPTDSGV